MGSSVRLAIPSNSPGGLEASRSDHFGHCDAYTIIDIEDGRIGAVKVLANTEHGAGGCMVPVRILHDEGVEAIVVGGIGARPMQGFAEAGIKVYFADRNTVKEVREAAEGFARGAYPLIRPDQACQGHGNCH